MFRMKTISAACNVALALLSLALVGCYTGNEQEPTAHTWDILLVRISGTCQIDEGYYVLDVDDPPLFLSGCEWDPDRMEVEGERVRGVALCAGSGPGSGGLGRMVLALDCHVEEDYFACEMVQQSIPDAHGGNDCTASWWAEAEMVRSF